MTSARTIAVCSSIALSLFAACSSRPTPAARSGRPAAAPAPTPPSNGQTVAATVLETIDASNYTYLRVKAGTGELWAAAAQFKAQVGERVVFSLEQPMENFHSQTLNRDFPLIYFVSQISREGETAAPVMAAGHSRAGAAEPAVTTVIERAAGETSVEALWRTRDTLAGSSVTVRGKVVKFNGGILGVNWIHLQDGTGSAAGHSNDITVTSDAEAQVGDVITATGTVALDKDFGAGYSYPVIIEHARVSRQ